MLLPVCVLVFGLEERLIKNKLKMNMIISPHLYPKSLIGTNPCRNQTTKLLILPLPGNNYIYIFMKKRKFPLFFLFNKYTFYIFTL